MADKDRPLVRRHNEDAEIAAGIAEPRPAAAARAASSPVRFFNGKIPANPEQKAKLIAKREAEENDKAEGQ